LNIHTLGPEITDSYAAAVSLLEDENDQIISYKSFDQMIHEIPNLKGELLLFPVGFESAKRKYSWKDFHYDYYEKLDIIKVFPKATKPMVLVKNKFPTENRAIIHPATKIFLEKYLKKNNKQTLISFADSKYKAWTAFLKKGVEYTVISLDVFEKETQNDMYIEETYEPEMIWCLYKVKTDNESRS